MRAIGLDIGTTTLSAVATGEGGGRVRRAITLPNDAALPGAPFERLQDPERLWMQASSILRELIGDTDSPLAIGLTGQMHGILYTDAHGEALSPLYTWQDERGEQAMDDGLSYHARLSQITGRPLATGYGAVTHFYNQENGFIPTGAAHVMTIQDYIGMKLTGRREPLTHVSDAASFGAPDWPAFARHLRVTAGTELLGRTEAGHAVAVAIGDNQASFIGSVRSPKNSVLINMGTGGQISVAIDRMAECPPCEVRPYVDGGALLVGFSLCGGRSYSLLERFFRQVASLADAPEGSMYARMNALADQPLADDPLAIRTQFLGTRLDPSLRGSIHNLSDANFTPAHFVQGLLRGMVDELHAPYLKMRPYMAEPPTVLVGSGNGIRENRALQRLFSEAFGIPLRIPAQREEAAYGAALFALCAAGEYETVEQAQANIRYLQDP